MACGLYAELFKAAAEAEHHLVTCEINAEPPNKSSNALHAGLGFAEVGRAAIEGGKTVRYLQKTLEPTAIPPSDLQGRRHPQK